jgi:hypothetical protein
LGGASFARHGVHDVHRAHYLNSSVGLQDGMPSRLLCLLTPPCSGVAWFKNGDFRVTQAR